MRLKGALQYDRRKLRRPLVDRVFGLAPDSSVEELKTVLHGMRAAKKGAKLDLVMVDNIAEYQALMCEQGMPLIREHDVLVEKDRVVVKKTHYRLVLLAALVGHPGMWWYVLSRFM